MSEMVTTDWCSGMHGKLEKQLNDLTSAVSDLTKQFHSFATMVAVQSSEVTRMNRDIDKLWEANRLTQTVIEAQLSKVDDRLKIIEALVQEARGVVITIRVLWALFGASALAWVAMAWSYLKGN
jgi:ABC-type transporter Mla subunit MlaD